MHICIPTLRITAARTIDDGPHCSQLSTFGVLMKFYCNRILASRLHAFESEQQPGIRTRLGMSLCIALQASCSPV